MAAIAATLARYSQRIITDITHPVSGLPSRSSWLPTVKEVHDACEAEALQIERFLQRERRVREQLEERRREERPAPLVADLDLPGRLAQVFVPTGHKRYSEFALWAQTADPKWWKLGNSSDGRAGIWVPWNLWADGGRS